MGESPERYACVRADSQEVESKHQSRKYMSRIMARLGEFTGIIGRTNARAGLTAPSLAIAFGKDGVELAIGDFFRCFEMFANVLDLLLVLRSDPGTCVFVEVLVLDNGSLTSPQAGEPRINAAMAAFLVTVLCRGRLLVRISHCVARR